MNKEHILRDLQWLMTCQSLLASPGQTLSLVREACSSLLDGSTNLSDAEWDELITAKTGRLGPYFEKLVTIALSHSNKILDLKTNITIHEGKRTVGELDCLYLTDQGWTHLELAVKFYLGVGDLAEEASWHGPALKDNLGKKLDRLRDHQLRLHETSAAISKLEEMQISVAQVDTIVLGCLFLPVNSTPVFPQTINPACETGWWMFEDRWRNWSPSTGLNWRFIWKPDWFAPIPSSGTDELRSPLDQPIMTVGFEGDLIKERGFIVPDGWGPN